MDGLTKVKSYGAAPLTSERRVGAVGASWAVKINMTGSKDNAE